jgi:hypothetical protein
VTVFFLTDQIFFFFFFFVNDGLDLCELVRVVSLWAVALEVIRSVCMQCDPFSFTVFVFFFFYLFHSKFNHSNKKGVITFSPHELPKKCAMPP